MWPGVVKAACTFQRGQSPEKPVYDTDANPADFPPAAVQLIEDIENREITDYETIAGRFEQLYEGNLELLDNDAWAKVITKLGTKFRVWADSLAEQGIEHYYKAGGLYALASFARPNDSRLREKKEMFEGWREAVDGGTPAVLFNQSERSATLHERIEVAKVFLLADSLSREFARSYLITPLFKSDTTDWLQPDKLTELRAADQAFLDYAGLAKFSFDDPLLIFDQGRVELIDCKLTRTDTGAYRVEAYFLPHDSIEVDYGIAFRIMAQDTSVYTFPFSNRQWTPYDFRPLTPSSEWPVDSVAAAVETVYYDGPAVPILIGLVAPDESGRPIFVGISNHNSVLYELPADAFPQSGTPATQ
jgi:hypothetical protein